MAAPAPRAEGAPPAPADPAPSEPPAPSAPAEPVTPWDRAVRAAVEKKPLLRAVLGNVRFLRLEGDVATLAANPGWATRVPKHLAEIDEFLSQEHGRPIRAILDEDPAAATPADAPTAGGADAPAAPPPPRPGVTDVSDHPMVKTALELFGGRIVDVQPRRPAP